MAISRSPSPSPPPGSFKRKVRPCARRVERGCCLCATYFPLAFVYGLTTWAVYVEASLGYMQTTTNPTVPFSRRCLSALGVLLYLLLNASYTTAVFTDPGSPNQDKKDTRGRTYSVLPTNEPHDLRSVDAITVSSTGGARYCKKCQVPKPDRTHHCSTCKRCVLKMDHHCPWLSTCLGLHNYKAFLLFLAYTSLFCWVCCISTSFWIWVEVFESRSYLSEFAPVQVIILAVISGIIGLVLTGFTAWHIYLCLRGQTTIECLEKTRYLAGVRKKVEQNRQDLQASQHRRGLSDGGITDTIQRAGGQLLEFHANAVPGALRYEEGEEHASPSVDMPQPNFSPSRSQYSDYPSNNNHSPAQQALRKNYSSYENDREQQRYDDYLDDKEASKMPNAFDLGWKNNLIQVLGPNPWLWALPVMNSIGDGWRWEVSQKWVIASEEAARRKDVRISEARANGHYASPPVQLRGGAARHYQDSNSYENEGRGAMSMHTLHSSRRSRRAFDRAEDGDVGSFEVSDTGSESSRDGD